MRKQMPENMPDRKPLQMKTCFESLPTLEISDEKMEKSRGHSTKNAFFLENIHTNKNSFWPPDFESGNAMPHCSMPWASLWVLYLVDHTSLEPGNAMPGMDYNLLVSTLIIMWHRWPWLKVGQCTFFNHFHMPHVVSLKSEPHASWHVAGCRLPWIQ